MSAPTSRSSRTPSSRPTCAAGPMRSGPPMPAWPGASSRPGPRPNRDFSHLAPRLPQFVAEQCVGCMACVSACPDSALIASVVPEADVAAAVARFAAEDPDRGSDAPRTSRRSSSGRRSTPTSRSGTASRPGRSACSSSPSRCKGCGECVEVCAALGHDALFMTDKVEGDAGPCVDDRSGRDDGAVPALAPADARGLSERQGARRPHARARTRSGMSAGRAPAPAAARRPRSG